MKALAGYASIAALVAVAACGHHIAARPSAGADAVAAGGAIAAERCASCHAIAPGAASPHPGAPTFSAIKARYELSILMEELAQGVHVGAAPMPTFDLSLEEVDALGAYLASLPDSSGS